jgi:integrase
MHQALPEHHLRMTRLLSGERFPLVLDHRGLLLATPTTYLTKWRRQAVSTVEDKARTLAMVHNFMRAYDIDLRKRVADGRLLDPWEIEALDEHLRSIGPRTAAIRTRAELNIRNYRARRTIQAQEWHRRRLRTADYLTWRVNDLIPTLALSAVSYQRIQKELARLRLGLVPDRKPPDNPARPALSREQVMLLLDAICPGSELNPYSEAHQFRNFALIATYCELGLRRSEVLALHCEDVSDPNVEHSLKLVRRPDDPDELRARPASIKTMPRPLPLTPVIHGILWEYITHHRRMIEVGLRSRGDKAALRRFKANPYLFVSSTGSALSSSSVYKIFDKLRTQVKGLPGYLSPHALRRTWNDLFVEPDQEDDVDERGVRLREFLMGWVTGSPQAARYAQGATQREAARAILEMQRNGMKRYEESYGDWDRTG